MSTQRPRIRELHRYTGIVRESSVSAVLPALAATGLRVCGHTLAGPPYAAHREAPDFAGLIATISGRGRALIDGVWQDLLPGSILCLPPDAPHAYEAVRAWRLAWVAGPPQPRPLLRGSGPWIHASDGEAFAEAVAALHREVSGRADPGLLGLLAARVRREGELLATPPTGDPLLWRLWREVGEDLARPWPLAELARRAGLGPEALRRRCLRACGAAPVAVLRRLRLERAAALLAQDDRTLADVALRVGYANPFALSIAFRRHFGRSPAAWRGGR